MTAPLKPKTQTYKATEPANRIDRYLARMYPELSRSFLQSLIEKGNILINGRVTKASRRLNIGDKISVNLPPSEPDHLTAEPIPLDIIFEDNDLAVINKPAGLTVHPSPGHPSHTLVNALLAHYPDLVDFNDSIRPGIVHRLDKDTSGLMIIAKNSSAQQNLIDQFKKHSVLKVYLVLVSGKLTPAQGAIEAPIGRDPYNRKRMAIATEGKHARTNYSVKEHVGNHSLLEVTLETGRTHQIRVHLSAIGHPVVGDAVYGVKSVYFKRQFVHAYRLGFHLPSSGSYQEFTCDLPRDLNQALELMRQSYNLR